MRERGGEIDLNSNKILNTFAIAGRKIGTHEIQIRKKI